LISPTGNSFINRSDNEALAILGFGAAIFLIGFGFRVGFRVGLILGLGTGFAVGFITLGFAVGLLPFF